MTEFNKYQPKQLNTLVMEYIDVSLIDFFESNHSSFKELKDKTINEVVKEAMTQMWPEISTADLFTHHKNNLLKAKRNKRGRWYRQFMTDLLRPYNDPKNPAHKEATQILSTDDKERLYGDANITPEGIVEFYKERIELWNTDRSKKLTDFPFLNFIRISSICSSFLLEININICTALIEICNGDVNNIYKQMFDFIVENPVISVSKCATTDFTYDEENDIYVEEYALSDVNDTLLKTYISPVNTGAITTNCRRIMDTTDQFIIEESLRCLSLDFISSKMSIVPLVNIARYIQGGGNPSRDAYKIAEQRCFALINYSYEVFKHGVMIKAYNVYSSIDTTEKEDDDENLMRKAIIFKFSDEAYSNIMQNKLSRVLSLNMNKLKSSFCKIIYYALQNERISLGYELNYFNMTSNIYIPKEFEPVEHDYTWFQQHSRMFHKNLKKTIDLITDGLTEFKELKIAVKDFTYENYCFKIQYYPLSPEEIEDLSHFNHNLIKEKP